MSQRLSEIKMMVGNRTRSSGGQPEGGKEDAEVA